MFQTKSLRGQYKKITKDSSHMKKSANINIYVNSMRVKDECIMEKEIKTECLYDDGVSVRPECLEEPVKYLKRFK
tara:strand:+ start:3301 stop:3525 length:225 start_codon:yes stop_codon:yes gene_type:complete